MFRALQTLAASKKLVKLFDAEKPETSEQKTHGELRSRSYGNVVAARRDSPLAAARRRRLRRARMATSVGAVKSAWF